MLLRVKHIPRKKKGDKALWLSMKAVCIAKEIRIVNAKGDEEWKQSLMLKFQKQAMLGKGKY